MMTAAFLAMALSQPPAKVTYMDSASHAAAYRRPLVVFVGGPSRAIEGCVTTSVQALAGYGVGDVVVAVPGRGWLDWRATLGRAATDADVRRAAGLEVSPSASPFDWPARRAASPDASSPAAGLWPKGLKKPDGLVRYESARYTQRTFDRQITGRGFIEAVSRSLVPSKWTAPGGLDGLTGWRNELWRSTGNRVREWRGAVDPSERYSEHTYQRSYADGALFYDVLIGPGERVFEVRSAEKLAGTWERLVVFRDMTAAPKGYSPVKQSQCAECHREAGGGGYGTARIPGGDTVLSDPLPLLEY